MHRASDKTSNILVDADDAYYGHGYYICPCCHNDVYKRGGYNIQRAAFAHYPGEGTSECEYYYGGGEYTIHPLQPQMHPHSLYVFVPDPNAVSPGWKLQLHIPALRSGWVTTGTVYLDQDVGLISIPVAYIPTGGKLMPVCIQKETYRLRASNDVDPEYLRLVTVDTPGLDTRRLNVFRFSLSEKAERRLESDTALYWGRGYYMVWHRAMPIEWPAALWRRQLRDNGDWCCAEVDLPEAEHSAVVQWASQFLQRKVEIPPLMPTLVTPTPLEQPSDDGLTIPYGQEVVIGIAHQHGASTPTKLCVTRADNQREEYPLHGSLPIVVSLGCPDEGSLIVWLPECRSRIEMIYLNIKQHSAPPIPDSVNLVFTSAESLGPVIKPAYCHDSQSLITEVRRGVQTLADVQLPVRVKARLYIQSTHTPFWQEQRLPSPQECFVLTEEGDIEQGFDSLKRAWHEYAERIRQEIIAQLTNSKEKWRLDFGSYGTLCSEEVFVLGRIPHIRHLAPTIRQRLQWLLTLPSPGVHNASIASGDGIQLLRKLVSMRAYAALEPTDRGMICLLLGRQTWPLAAEPHLRLLAREIECALHIGVSTTA